MAVDIGQAIKEGGRRTLARNGLLLVAVFWIFGIANGLFTNTIMEYVFRNMPMDMPGGALAVGPTIGISPVAAGAITLVVGLLSLLISATAIRTFVTAETETIPAEYFTRNVLWMVLNLIVGGIVFGLLVSIGFIITAVVGWIVPTLIGGGVVFGIVVALGFLAASILGVFLLVSLFFWNVVVIVEDRNFVEGFSTSWALTKGNRIMLFVLGVVVVIVAVVVGGVFGVAQPFLPAYVGLAITQIGGAFASVFSVATAARTYGQLKVKA